MKQIPLTRDKVAIVDDEDYARLVRHKWYTHVGSRNHTYYACRNLSYKTKLFMHREILGVMNRKLLVDHINHNGLDNRRSNLRICNSNQSSVNKYRRSNNTSGFQGVTRWRNKWQAYICVDYKQHHLGLFKSKEDAARAYDAAAIKYFGEFATLNFLDKQFGANS